MEERKVLLNTGVYLLSDPSNACLQVACEKGCSCNSSVLDGNQTERTSQVHMAGFYVSQSADCIVAVTGAYYQRISLYVTTRAA